MKIFLPPLPAEEQNQPELVVFAEMPGGSLSPVFLPAVAAAALTDKHLVLTKLLGRLRFVEALSSSVRGGE